MLPPRGNLCSCSLSQKPLQSSGGPGRWGMHPVRRAGEAGLCWAQIQKNSFHHVELGHGLPQRLHSCAQHSTSGYQPGWEERNRDKLSGFLGRRFTLVHVASRETGWGLKGAFFFSRFPESSTALCLSCLHLSEIVPYSVVLVQGHRERAKHGVHGKR